MKSITYISMILLGILVGCSHGQPEIKDRHITIIVDPTDPLQVSPNAEMIAKSLMLSNKWHGSSVRIVIINETSVTESLNFSIPRSSHYNQSNKERNNKLRVFIDQIDSALKQIGKYEDKPNSSIYKVIVEEISVINRLPLETNKQILIFSNLMENSELSFYDSNTQKQLISTPDEIKAQLNHLGVIPSIQTGVEIQLIYDSPKTVDLVLFERISDVFRELFEEAGAKVVVSKNLQFSSS